MLRPDPARALALVLATILVLPSLGAAQVEALRPADPADVATPEAIVQALYESIQRAPGENYDWDRNLSLFLPGAALIPNTEQSGGEFVIHTPVRFMEIVDSLTVVGGAGDQGFAEEQIAVRIERYGDIAQVFSTYQKHFWDDPNILGRGINSIQLVHHQDRWWIVSVVWDEESGAGPLPERYRPR